MDRLNQLRGEAGGSRDSTLDTSSPPSEAFMTANESSKYFSLSEDSEFDISPIKDTSLAAPDPETTVTDDHLISNLSPIGKKSDLDSYKIGKQIEAANILSGGVDIFEDNDNSNDGNELIIDDNADEDKSNELILVDTAEFKGDEETLENVSETDTPIKDTEVVLQIDGKNVDAIDIGNGLYLYRKEGEEELAAVQIIDDDQHQPSFKFLKVRENAEGNLEVYEEIQIEVPKELPAKGGKNTDKNISHLPIKDINKVISEPTSDVVDKATKIPQVEVFATPSKDLEADSNKDLQSESKEVNLNTKIKLSEARKSPVIGSFTPMTYHSTPNKEGKPLTKTMVDLQLHPSRHSDNVKKTIEVHTDNSKQKSSEIPSKSAKDNESKSPDSKFELKESEVKNTVCEQKTKESEVSAENQTSIEDKADKSSDTNTPKTEAVRPGIEISKELHTTEKRHDTKEDIKVIENEVKSNPTDNLPSQSNLEKRNSEVKPSNIISCKITEESVPKINENSNVVSSSTETKEASSLHKESMKDVKLLKPEKETGGSQQVKVGEVSSSQEAHITEKTKSENVEVIDNVDQDSDKLNTETPERKEKVKDVEKATSEDLKECAKSDILRPEQNTSKESPVSLQVVTAQATVSSEKPAESKAADEMAKVDNVNNKQDTILDINCKKPELQTFSDHVKPEILEKMKTDILSKETEQSMKVVNEVKPNLPPVDSNKSKDVKPVEINKVVAPSADIDKKEIPKLTKPAPIKPINNNHAAVPFGKWTEANRQEFLNKIKESKVPTNHSNGKQIKNSNDLNRRDILKKIDSQRSNIATAKAQEIANIAKLGQGVKKEAPIFINKSSVSHDTKIPMKSETQDIKSKPAIISRKTAKHETVPNPVPEMTTATATSANAVKKELRTEINNQDLIDKTIDDIIGKAVTVKDQDDTNAEKNTVKESAAKSKREEKPRPVEKPKINERKAIEKRLPVHRPKPIERPKPTEKPKPVDPPKPVVKQGAIKTGMTLLDDIEMEMNKLHGIPFVERPQHELPQVSQRQPFRTYSKAESEKDTDKNVKVPKLLPFVNKAQQKMIKDSTIDLDSEEEIIEHEPITGDIEMNKKELPTKSSNAPIYVPSTTTDSSKKEAIITENDFDKFARRNSKTYENCLKVNFDGSESHNVIQTVVEKDNLKIGPKTETVSADSKTAQKDLINTKPVKKQNLMFTDNDPNKHYPSKVKMAYQSVMTAKRQLERPITIIEDKPVKVMYVDSNMDFNPHTLNVQGKELTPPSIHIPEIDANTASSCDSLDSDLGIVDDAKSQDEIRSKTKHQRKQVLTPVDNPDLELIEPEDLGYIVSPKKKRRTEESRHEKSPRALVPKKSYLLGRNTEDKVAKTVDLSQNTFKESLNKEEPPKTHNAASAIDSLVKAAALIETQSENVLNNVCDTPSTDSPTVTPAKRGRGRPRKYPLPEGAADKNKAPSPQKKPRLIDAKIKKPEPISDDDSSEDEVIKENWTMGKINENIVCPICSKLFRSENVVFKHVKHCTGPSPNRSDSDKRSPRRGRFSQESESTESKTTDDTDFEIEKIAPKKRKSKESPVKPATEKDDIIVIEDTPIKERIEKREVKTHETKKVVKNKVQDNKVNNLVCEICGKTFRQLSYLVSHKLLHGKDEQKKVEPAQDQSKSVFSCDVCKKEFRKLHHLVQHRIIHNPNAMPARLSRKSSLEQKDNKIDKDQVSKQSEDPSAGFRCEPCDKSFRKLHHLVEHRETHDGINRQKIVPAPPVHDKLPPPPQCEVCKKTFRKLHHLIEHKEQHLETSSEKSDDKSVKSSLSTKDIIHECSLCYMVFPNEHSLTKHTVICQKKKKQSATKALKQLEDGSEVTKDQKEDTVSEPTKQDEDLKTIEEIASDDTQNSDIPISKFVPERKSTESNINSASEQKSQITPEVDKPEPITVKESEKETTSKEPDTKLLKETKQIENASKVQVDSEIPVKIPKTDEKETGKTAKKKTLAKEKSATVAKRQKSISAPLPVVAEVKAAESSDDDEVRYMLNPDFKVEETAEAKIFMKVKAKKRNSLQIERPNSKDLVKRRISLQHPPKIPRLKPKPIVPKVPVSTVAPVKSKPDLDPVPSTDSDDSDVKYSFPKPTVEKAKLASQETPKEAKSTPRKSLADKRKSLGGIAKRKSMGKAIIAKHKVKPSPLKTIKRRTAEIEHRCDCGQLFSSAALLCRHTSLAHTPPRVRRRRSPPPAAASASAAASRPHAESRKSSTRSDTSNKERNSEKPSAKSEVRKSIKVEESTKKTSTKVRRSNAHRGVPVPEKMRKLMEKMK
ncbi:uncharacterized protein LOC128671198 [Plodia interpunctella]|uniref:uncharacterized protein LOC128671198 n=1 Tax=Plodia interpunctella TaxID=58824 RepID=UPI0023675412|nr:uncharacterized protein LOC128671198 [Plodia interpunctella]XP_053603472.1 uncharacterized protein LOC128671198 [Plodia interpunctella]